MIATAIKEATTEVCVAFTEQSPAQVEQLLRTILLLWLPTRLHTLVCFDQFSFSLIRLVTIDVLHLAFVVCSLIIVSVVE